MLDQLVQECQRVVQQTSRHGVVHSKVGQVLQLLFPAGMVLAPVVAASLPPPVLTSMDASVPVAGVTTTVGVVTIVSSSPSLLAVASSSVEVPTSVSGGGPDFSTPTLGESSLHADDSILGRKRSREEGALLTSISLAGAETPASPPSALALWKTSLQRRAAAGSLAGGAPSTSQITLAIPQTPSCTSSLVTSLPLVSSSYGAMPVAERLQSIGELIVRIADDVRNAPIPVRILLGLRP